MVPNKDAPHRMQGRGGDGEGVYNDGIIVDQYAGLIPAELESLAPEERHRVYRLLRLQAVPGRDGSVEIKGVIGAANGIYESQTTSG